MMLRRYHKKANAVVYTYEQLDELKVPQIKEILDSKQIEYKSNDNKKDLIAYLVEVPKENPDPEKSENPVSNDGDNNVDAD